MRQMLMSSVNPSQTGFDFSGGPSIDEVPSFAAVFDEASKSLGIPKFRKTTLANYIAMAKRDLEAHEFEVDSPYTVAKIEALLDQLQYQEARRMLTKLRKAHMAQIAPLRAKHKEEAAAKKAAKQAESAARKAESKAKKAASRAARIRNIVRLAADIASLENLSKDEDLEAIQHAFYVALCDAVDAEAKGKSSYDYLSVELAKLSETIERPGFETSRGGYNTAKHFASTLFRESAKIDKANKPAKRKRSSNSKARKGPSERALAAAKRKLAEAKKYLNNNELHPDEDAVWEAVVEIFAGMGWTLTISRTNAAAVPSFELYQAIRPLITGKDASNMANAVKRWVVKKADFIRQENIPCEISEFDHRDKTVVSYLNRTRSYITNFPEGPCPVIEVFGTLRLRNSKGAASSSSSNKAAPKKTGIMSDTIPEGADAEAEAAAAALNAGYLAEHDTKHKANQLARAAIDMMRGLEPSDDEDEDEDEDEGNDMGSGATTEDDDDTDDDESDDDSDGDDDDDDPDDEHPPLRSQASLQLMKLAAEVSANRERYSPEQLTWLAEQLRAHNMKKLFHHDGAQPMSS